jgi:hypothetical protein
MKMRRLRSGGWWFQANLGKEVCEIASQWKKLDMVGYTYHPVMVRSINRRTMVQASLDIK